MSLTALLIYIVGLCGQGVSFQVRKYPTHFLTSVSPGVDTDYYITGTVVYSDDDFFRPIACFTPKRGRYQSGGSEPFVTFESHAIPGTYIYHVQTESTFHLRYDDLSDDFA